MRKANARPPTRYAALDAARKIHGERVDRYLAYAGRVDPLADEAAAALSALPPRRAAKILDDALAHGIDSVPRAPRAVRALFEQVEHVPFWVDFAELERGGKTMMRSGLFGALVLICYSLPLSYTSPGGNKPLVFTGELVKKAPERLSYTGRFFLETCLPGGLRRGAVGYRSTVRVRLRHAMVRRAILDRGGWNEAAFGAPVNQADLVGTNLMFSIVALRGLKRLGFRISREEAQAYLALWRYSGYLIGVDAELLPRTEAEAEALLDLTLRVQRKPDRDSRALVRALLDAPVTVARSPKSEAQGRRLRSVYAGVMRTFLGKEMADELRIPVNRWRHAVTALRPVIANVERLRAAAPFGTAYVTAAGTLAWRRAIYAGASHVAGEFAVLRQVRNLLDTALLRRAA